MANKTMHHLVIEDNNYEILDAKNRANIAAEYSASSTYNVGDVVLYNGQLYKCTTAISTAEAWTAAHWTAVTVGEKIADLEDDTNQLKEDLEASAESITEKMIKVSSNNLLKSDSDYTQGYIAQNGVPQPASTLGYTRKIPVSEGDIVRYYNGVGSGFAQQGMRYVCAYDADGDAVSASGAESATSYTVPNGIAFVVITFYFSATNKMVTINYEPIAYEPYFAPYYIASEEFVKNVLNNYELTPETIKGYNLIPDAVSGSGYYYGQYVGQKIKFGSSENYRHAVIQVKKNTFYYASMSARFWAFTDNDDVVISFGENSVPINSGDATKLYFSIDKGSWENGAIYGKQYSLIIAEGISGTYNSEKKPPFVSGLSQNMMDAKSGCALPKRPPRFTLNQKQIWYTKNMSALPTNEVDFVMSGLTKYVEGGVEINPNVIIRDTGAGYMYRVYDNRLACISQLSHRGLIVCADNLQDCSALVIGDSTVAQNYLTAGMIDKFASKEKTLTLLGTRGTAPNLHEGRAGWSAASYCTASESASGISNPFFNSESQKFDFSYYMANKGYDSVDFVVLQLGINDLYNEVFIKSDDVIKATADYIKEMVDSILAFNAGQKILLNLPTAINDDQTKQYHLLSTVRNMFVRYNEYIQYYLYNYYRNVRFSQCHLILDPSTDIADDVHPTVTGYTKMANEVVSQINCWQN